jgi:hypothetical protein
VKGKKILITTESHEIFVLRTNGQKHAVGFCSLCAYEVEWLTLDQSVSESGLRTNALVQMAEAGDVHTIETLSGHLIFCARSIAALTKLGGSK